MRLAVLMNVGSPWSREAAQRLTELGHQVHVVDFCGPGRAATYLRRDDVFQRNSIDGFAKTVTRVHFLHSRFKSELRYFTAFSQVSRLCRMHDCQLLLTLYGGGQAIMAWLSRVRPYVVYVVGSDVLLVMGVRRQVARFVLGAAREVFANGTHLAAQTRYLAPRARVIPLYLGVDTSRFHPGEGDSAPPGILCTRGFLPVYSNDYLIRALACLQEPQPDFRVTFVSAGPQLNEARQLADRLLAAPVRSRVQFLGGVSQERLLDELRSASIYVSLSKSDGTSTSLLEALACGLFPVLSDIPQNREWITPELKNGILVPLDRPESVAEALRRALGDDGLRARAVEINRRLVLERADGRRNIGALATRLESILNGQAN
jgi:glycosyltransferase involved in cell wall biosynthesis